ncbi:MAG TPA: HAD family hydrolase [Blastocatellia bacterium]|nr:HAD family hydrolase [Blastocatellia bacterium]
MRRAVFMDRDGTVSDEVGYLNHVSRLRVYPWSASAIRALNDAGLLAVLVTNQAGVARGYFPETMILDVHARLVEELAAQGATLDAIYYCPHHPTAGEPPYRADCECRKPRPGMLLQAAAEHDIDLASSYVVGDKYSDVRLAHAVGASGVLVMTGYGRGEYEYERETWPRAPEHVAESLEDAVAWIVAAAVGEAE